MEELSIFWEQLLQLIDEGKVVPMVGPDLLTVPESTGHKLLYPWLAERLAKYLKVAAGDLPPGGELNEVACRYLGKGRPAQHIYAGLKTVAVEADNLPVPEPLLQLAAIRPLQLFVTTTFDSLLVRALNQKRFGGNPNTRVFAHAPNDVQDLPADLNDLGSAAVYHLMGKLSATPAYAVTQEDLIEFFHSLQSDTRRPAQLFHELSNRSLLLLGTRLSGWLTSFLMRMSKRQRLSSNEMADYVADDVVGNDASLVLFLERFSSATEIYREGGAIEFVRELHQHWTDAASGDAPSAVRSHSRCGLAGGARRGLSQLRQRRSRRRRKAQNRARRIWRRCFLRSRPASRRKRLGLETAAEHPSVLPLRTSDLATDADAGTALLPRRVEPRAGRGPDGLLLR